MLFALLRQQTNMALKTRTLLVKKRYLQIPLTIPSEFAATNVTVIITYCVLLLVPMKQSIPLTKKELLCAHLWAVESETDRYMINRYINRYKTSELFLPFRMPPKMKTTKKVRNLDVNKTPSKASKGKYSKRSPQSSHRGEKVAEYTLEEMLAAKAMYEQNKALPLGQQMSQGELAEASGIKLGTLSKRITGEVPWTCNVGGGAQDPQSPHARYVYLYR